MAGDSDDVKYAADLALQFADPLGGSRDESRDDTPMEPPSATAPVGNIEVDDGSVMVGGVRVPRRA